MGQNKHLSHGGPSSTPNLLQAPCPPPKGRPQPYASPGPTSPGSHRAHTCALPTSRCSSHLRKIPAWDVIGSDRCQSADNVHPREWAAVCVGCGGWGRSPRGAVGTNGAAHAILVLLTQGFIGYQ